MIIKRIKRYGVRYSLKKTQRVVKAIKKYNKKLRIGLWGKCSKGFKIIREMVGMIGTNDKRVVITNIYANKHRCIKKIKAKAKGKSTVIRSRYCFIALEFLVYHGE